MPLACERPVESAPLWAFQGGLGLNPARGTTQRTQLPAPAQRCPHGLRSQHLILQEKRVVSRNWARSTLGPGAANEMLEDEEVEDHAGTFCLEERVELAVTMENKAKVSRVGGQCPGTRQVASSSLALPCCPSSPPPGQAGCK